MFYLTHILHAFLMASQRQQSKLITHENCINVGIPNSVLTFPFSRYPYRQTEAPLEEGIMEVCVLIDLILIAGGYLIMSLQIKASETICSPKSSNSKNEGASGQADTLVRELI